MPYTTIARPAKVATIPQAIEPAAATRSAMTIDRPMSRNANAVSTKATYSQTVSIAWRVRSLTPACAASLPRTIRRPPSR